MMEDGICEIEPGLYSRTMKFSDINYQTARRDDQVDIFSRYCEVLNYCDPSVHLQISIINRSIDREAFQEAMFMPMAGDALDAYRKEMNGMLSEKALEGQNTVIREKYLTFSTSAPALESAIPALARLDTDLGDNLKSLGCELMPLSGTQRLELVHSVFHPNERFNFRYNDLVFNGLNTKSAVAPSSLDFRPHDYFRFGEHFGQCLYLRELPTELSDKVISDISDLPINMIITLHITNVDQIEALELVRSQIAFMEMEATGKQNKAVQNNQNPSLAIPMETRRSYDEALKLLDQLENKNQRMFKVSTLVYTFSDTLEELQDNAFQIMATARKNNVKFDKLDLQQREGLNSTLPLGKNYVSVERTLTTASTAIFVPFTTMELYQNGGKYYGLNASSRNLIFFNRESLAAPNGMILGTPGCFPGDTKITLADGKKICIKDTLNLPDTFKVKSYDINTRREVIGVAKNARITGETKRLIKITFANHKTVRCTPEHEFLNSDGIDFICAKDLLSDESLCKRFKITSICEEHLEEDIPLYDFEVEGYCVFQLDNGMYVHNSGKSFSAKREMSSVLLNDPNSEVLVVDPEREYTGLAQGFDGEVVHISAGSKDHINPMDITMDYSDDEDPLSLKQEFILDICELLIGGRTGLDGGKRSVIDRACKFCYQKYFNNPCKENLPTLEDFYNQIKAQPEQVAQSVALDLELYIKGSLGVFAHQTNVNTQKRFVVYDIKDLGKQLRTFGMYVVLDQIWNRITANRAKGKRTWIYIDEFQLLVSNEYASGYFFELWSRARKWGAIPTGITQNVETLLMSDDARRMLSNSEFIMMLRQATSDRTELAGLLNISNEQLRYVTNSNPGQGLLFAGKSIVPFTDNFPEDTELFKLMNTKPDKAPPSSDRE